MKKILFLVSVLAAVAFFPMMKEWLSPYPSGAPSHAANTSISREAAAEQSASQAPGKFQPDVDLTAMSSTMVFSQVLNMLVSPDDYIGKKIRMKGRFIPL